MELWKELLGRLEVISIDARQKMGEACELYMMNAGSRDPEMRRAMFLAALDGMADLIQYGELGPTAIERLHNARREAGIFLPEADERRKQKARP
jgi:hypothetical protein